jgi:hypothetical protein
MPLPMREASAEVFEARAIAMARGRGPVIAGRLHLVSFDALRDREGDAWAQVWQKTELLMRAAIERRLNPGDFYRQVGEHDFVVLFAALSAQEAKLRLAQITDELTRALTGEFAGAKAEVLTETAQIDSKHLLAVSKEQGDIPQAIVTEINKAAMMAPAEAASRFHNVRFLFRPIWDVRRNAVINFLAVPVVKTLGGRIVSGESAIEGLADDRHARLEYDILLLRRVISELMRVGAQDRRLLFTIPVHVDTISMPGPRTEFLKVWRELPLVLQRLAMFDLVGASDGFPQSRLIEILPSLKPVSRAITLRLPLTAAPVIGRFAHVGLHALSAEAALGREEAQSGEFEKFVVAAEKALLLTYLHGIKTGSLARAAVAAGFHCLDGPAIGNAEANPKDALRFSAADLQSKP